MSGFDFSILTGSAGERTLQDLPGVCFQQASWVRAVAEARSRPHELVLVKALAGDGKVSWLPGGVHRRAGISVFESMPMAGYGGWIGDDLGLDAELALNRAWLAQAPWTLAVLTSRPGREATLPAARAMRWAPTRWQARLATRDFTTHVLALHADEAAQLALARSSVRSYLRKLAPLGFEFERADDEAALVRMHDWYRRGSLGWQQPATGLLPAAFFTELRNPGRAEVWTVHFRGQAVGAALFLLGRDEVQYQASGVERIDSTLSATEAVVWAAIRHYSQQGFATMNFGASEGLDSVARFKRKFGAEAMSYRHATYLLPRRLGLGREPGR